MTDRQHDEPEFDERRFMGRERAEADDTVDLHEHDPAPAAVAEEERKTAAQPIDDEH